MSTSVPEEHVARVGRSSRLRPWLVGVNLALGAGVIVASLSAGAAAQPGSRSGAAQMRPRGEYTMISSRYQGGSSAAVYILDAANQEMAVLRWNRTADRFEPIGLRSFVDDARFFKGAR